MTFFFVSSIKSNIRLHMEISKVLNEIAAGVHRIKELYGEDCQKTLEIINETVLQLWSSMGTTGNTITLHFHYIFFLYKT